MEWPARGTAAMPGARSANGSTPGPASPAVGMPAPEKHQYNTIISYFKNIIVFHSVL